MAENKQIVNTRIEFASNVDKKARIIYNVSVCTSGEALGHGVWTDKDFIQATADQINNAGKIKSMFGHGGMCAESMGNEIGWFTNARSQVNAALSEQLGYEVWQCIADFHATAVTAKNRDLLDHVFVLAKKDPTIIGTSIVFWPGPMKTDENGDAFVDNPLGMPHETMEKLLRCDFVSDPANNPTGVFSRKNENNKEKEMPTTTKTQKSGVLAGMLKSVVDQFKRSNDIQEQRMRSAGLSDKPPTMRVNPAKPDAKKSKSPIKRRAVYFSDIDLGPDYGYLRTATDVPAVGDPVDWVKPDGEVLSPADDGDYTAVDGTIYSVEGGIIVEIIAPMDEGADDTQIEAGANTGTETDEAALARKKMSEMAKNITRLEKLIADKTAQETSGKRSQHIMGSKSRGYDRIMEGVLLVAEARSNQNLPKELRSDVHFTRPRGKTSIGGPGGIELFTDPRKRATGYTSGTGVDFGQTLEHCARYLPELFFERIIIESLQKQFKYLAIDEKLGGDATVTKKIPIISDSAGLGGYAYGGGNRIKQGIFCDPIDDGETIFKQRSITARGWSTYREYCPRQWGNFLDAMVYVNDQEIPFQSVVFELYLSEVLKEWEDLLLNGNYSAGHAFDGIVYQMDNDPDIPTAQIITPYVPTASTAVSLFEQLYLAVPKTMYGRNDMKWFMPSQDTSLYRMNYRSQFNIPYNTTFDKTWVDLSMFKGEMIESIHMPQIAGRTRQFIIPATDLWIIMSREPTIEAGYIPDRGKIWLKIEAHTGVGYPISQNITLAKQ